MYFSSFVISLKYYVVYVYRPIDIYIFFKRSKGSSSPATFSNIERFCLKMRKYYFELRTPLRVRCMRYYEYFKNVYTKKYYLRM